LPTPARARPPPLIRLLGLPAAALGGTDAVRLVTGRAREAEAAGVDDIWLNQELDLDSVTVAALVAREVPRVVIGTAVVPMYYHHPVSLTGTAKAAQLAAGGRFARPASPSPVPSRLTSR
jgi:alkanesulfonate monooxygenase SsuD/methylene tetrahydromethanopterin reductase-like flavin-dependent oxidoreductase (luciferase family)